MVDSKENFKFYPGVKGLIQKSFMIKTVGF